MSQSPYLDHHNVDFICGQLSRGKMLVWGDHLSSRISGNPQCLVLLWYQAFTD